MGTKMTDSEIIAALSHELYRVSYAGHARLPSLPSAASPSFLLADQPKAIPSLVGSIADANAHILASLARLAPAAPVARTTRPAPLPAPVVVTPAAPTRTAVEIQSEIPKVDLSQYRAPVAVREPNLTPTDVVGADTVPFVQPENPGADGAASDLTNLEGII
jgi:hypothetical protein